MADSLVHRATSDQLIDPDWAMKEICDILNRDPGQAKDAAKALKRRIAHKSPKVQLLALTLLETIVKNCGDIVHMHVAETDLPHEMVNLSRKKCDLHVKEKILALIDSWQEAFGGPHARYPQYFAAYNELHAGDMFPQRAERPVPYFKPQVLPAGTYPAASSRSPNFQKEDAESAGTETPPLIPPTTTCSPLEENLDEASLFRATAKTSGPAANLRGRSAVTSPPSPPWKRKHYLDFDEFAEYLVRLQRRQKRKWKVGQLREAASNIADALQRNGGILTREEVRAATRHNTGDTGLIDFVLSKIGNTVINGQSIQREKNQSTDLLEFSIVDVEGEHVQSSLQDNKAKHEETIQKLTREKNALYDCNRNLKRQVGFLRLQLASSQGSQQEVLIKHDNLHEQLRTVTAAFNTASARAERLEAELQSLKERMAKQLEVATEGTSKLERTCDSQRLKIENLNKRLENTTAANTMLRTLLEANEKLKETVNSRKEQVVSLSVKQTEIADRTIRELKQQLGRAEARISEGEALRKKLHNTILELKGNIRVFCRVRPFMTHGDMSQGSAISFPTTTETVGRGIDLTHQTQIYPFTFDRVFGPNSSQHNVFVEISQLVQSVLDGYKVCIFAYGQTGSGKTYTMMGRQSSEGEKGMLPRSLHQIFDTTRALTVDGWEYCMRVSMLEIYNESIRDLLLPARPGMGPESSSKQYNIKHDANGNTKVSDLNIVDVHSQEDVDRILRQAEDNRSVGRTQMNEQSSRSHCVFTLRISGINKRTEQQLQGVLNLIDLAGSERLSKSGATGDRLKETQSINKSLSALSDVISSLANKEDHVPFRNSKLTYLLQPCLGGDSKTLMFVNVSPEGSSSGETLCSLRFAARVNSCKIGIPRRQTQQSKLSLLTP